MANGPVYVSIPGPSGFQTPWASNINAANYMLGNVASINVGGATTPLASLEVHSTPAGPNAAGYVNGVKITIGTDYSLTNPIASNWTALYTSIVSNSVMFGTGTTGIWGANFLAGVLTGSDISTWGLEVDLNNDSTTCPLPFNDLQKLVVNAVSGGTNQISAFYSTGASVLGSSPGNRGLYGLYMQGVGGSSGSGSALIACDPSVTSGFASCIPDYGVDLLNCVDNFGQIRLRNSGEIVSRNAAGTADVPIMYFSSSNVIQLANITQFFIYNASLSPTADGNMLFWVDESGNNLHFVVKYSSGPVKSCSIAIS